MKLFYNKSMAPTDKSGQRMELVSIHWRALLLFFFFVGLSFLACGSSEIKPVDIYPEDMCSECRMAISNQAFAAEIIATTEEVFKFDDLGCMERFKEKSRDLGIAAIFVMDYETKAWLPFERSIIVQTSLTTPMGYGKVALADSNQAKRIREKFPPRE